MTRYEKGAKFERSLVKEFWERGWTAMRSAGSGNTSLPAPDVIAIRDGEVVLIECKSTSREKLNLKGAVLSLHEFSKISGGRAYIAVKFLRQDPRFYSIDEFLQKKKFSVSAKHEYQNFDTVVGRQRVFG